MKKNMITIDGNGVAHKVNEVIAIYPITPSSSMGEMADAFSAAGQTNIWGTVPLVVEMQSEGGAAAAVHGALQTGALTTTFTAVAGPAAYDPQHVQDRRRAQPRRFPRVGAQPGDAGALHLRRSQRRDGGALHRFCLLASNSVQEAHDFALIAQAATLEARVPFIHFFDGFRTSNEINKIEQLTLDDLKAMIDDDLVRAHRSRAMNPEKPVTRGTSQGPDVYFQGRETVNPFYTKTPGIVQAAMDKFAQLTGRQYRLFDYVGAPDAEHVIVMMGSGAEVAHETVEYLNAHGENVGLLKVHLYRPFDVNALAAALPQSVKLIAALDRTKEPGAIGEPLYADIITALTETGRTAIQVIGGRYGLSSKEFTPAMVKAIFDEMKKDAPKNHFTVGINDDVTHTSIVYDRSFNIEPKDVVRAMFFGLGSDGTVGANHDTIEIIGMETDNYAQGYFAYDAKKSGGYTVSHLRFGPRPIRQTCQISSASFIGCHQFVYLEKLDVLGPAIEGGTFLLNTPYDPTETWDKMPRHVQQQIIDKKLKFYAINAYDVASKVGMSGRINTIMQTCFFALSGVLPKDEAIAEIKKAIHKRFISKGQKVVDANYAAVDNALANLVEIDVPAVADSTVTVPPIMVAGGPAFLYEVAAKIASLTGNDVPVSAMPVDGTVPTGTTQYEKRSIALEMPVWNPDVCIQCGKCAMACPHAVIRMKIYDPALLEGAPEGFQSVDARGKKFEGMKFTIQAAPEDCTGCGLCVETCPAKDKANPELKAINMTPQPAIRVQQREYWDFFFNKLPDFARSELNLNTVKETQLLRPLFEFSGACGGCGETPYVRLVSQLFGDRAMIANATGCSSIYGGHMPTTPYTVNDERARPHLEQQPVRGRRRVRVRLPAHRRQAHRCCCGAS
jgi:pyruvate-ferredoxin/flavodoxin oxidoreductase